MTFVELEEKFSTLSQIEQSMWWYWYRRDEMLIYENGYRLMKARWNEYKQELKESLQNVTIKD